MTSITIKVKTNSGRSELIEKDDYYLAYLKSLPESGKANEELLKLVKKHFKKDAKIVVGKTSKTKIIHLL